MKSYIVILSLIVSKTQPTKPVAVFNVSTQPDMTKDNTTDSNWLELETGQQGTIGAWGNHDNLTTSNECGTNIESSLKVRVKSSADGSLHWNACLIPTNGTWGSENVYLHEPLSVDTLDTFRFAVNLILLPLIAIPGCVCNVFNVFIYSRENMRNSINYYLAGLSVADLLFLASTIVQWVFYMIEYFNKTLYFQIMLRMHTPIFDFFFTLFFGRTANVLTFVISIERFIAVKFPFLAKSSPLRRHPIKIIVVVYMIVFAMVIPVTLKFKFGLLTQTDSNATVLRYKQSELFQTYPEFFNSYVVFILITTRLLPVCLVLVLNTYIIVILSLSRKSIATAAASNIDVRQRDELKLTRMLITIAIIFIVCVFPGFLHAMFQIFVSSYFNSGSHHNLWVIFFTTYPLLETINAAVNFIVYVLMSKKFRTHCLNAIRGNRRERLQATENAKSTFSSLT